jgi:hypothetical protein
VLRTPPSPILVAAHASGNPASSTSCAQPPIRTPVASSAHLRFAQDTAACPSRSRKRLHGCYGVCFTLGAKANSAVDATANAMMDATACCGPHRRLVPDNCGRHRVLWPHTASKLARPESCRWPFIRAKAESCQPTRPQRETHPLLRAVLTGRPFCGRMGTV